MDRIIVKTNNDMQRVVDWAEQLTGMAVELPFPSGEIEFQEEHILLRFCDEGAPIVSFEIDIRAADKAEYHKVVEWRSDLDTGEITDLKIAGDGLTNKAQLGMIITQDNTIGKCILKFRAIMLFAAYYREDIQRTKTIIRTGGGGKKSKRANRRPLTIRRYTISEAMLSELPAPKKEWHGYRETFGVRGHFRRYKTGKVSWVRPYEKKGRADKRADREYIL